MIAGPRFREHHPGGRQEADDVQGDAALLLRARRRAGRHEGRRRVGDLVARRSGNRVVLVPGMLDTFRRHSLIGESIAPVI